MTEKEYDDLGGGCPLMNFENCRSWYNTWFMRRAKVRKRFMVTGDNREVFLKLFGKSHFHFHGSHYFHGWDIMFNDGRFLLLTAKDHGTSIEQIGKCRAETRIEFLEWLANKLTENEK